MLDLIIKALACYRVSRFVSIEEGPFAIFESLREKLDSPAVPRWLGWLARGVGCPYCISVWVGLALEPRRPIHALAISAGACLIYRVFDKFLPWNE